jgi:hypothetical protein
MLMQLKTASTSAASIVEQKRIDAGKETTEQLQKDKPQEDGKKEETIKILGKKQGKKSSAKKKVSTPTPSVGKEEPSTAPIATTSTALTAATDIEPTSSLHILVPQVESRLQALQEKIASMEESRENLAASKTKSEEELRDSRIAIELITAEKQKLASHVEIQQKKLTAAEKLAKEQDAALKAGKLRVAELTEEVVESKTVRSKEQEDVDTRWKAKVTTLTSEVEKLKTELETAVQGTIEAKKAQKTAEIARLEAEQKEFAAEQRAFAATNEAAQLRAASSQAQDQSEQLIRDNERRSKTFNAAVEAQVQRFKATLEEERDTALARVEEAQEHNRNLQQRVNEFSDELQKVKDFSEEHAVAVMVEKNRVEEYEQVVATMNVQVAAAVKASQSAETELENRQAQWEEEKESLKNKVVMLETELKTAVDKARNVELSVTMVRTEAERWRAIAQQVGEAQAAATMARHDAETANAEGTALKMQLAHLQRELKELEDANTDAGGSDFGTAPPLPSAAGVIAPPVTKIETVPLPGSSLSFKREPTSDIYSGFDLESLRRTPLLSGHTKTAGTGMEQRRASLLIMGSTKQVVWMYMALVHVLLLVAMGRASHAHLACEHLHLQAVEGGLP